MRSLLLLVVIAALVAEACARNAPQKRHFDVSAGEATLTLPRFVEQSGEQVLYVVTTVRGVQTRKVKGVFTTKEAIDQMLVGTTLSFVEDPESGAFMIQQAAKTAEGLSGSPGEQPEKPLQPTKTKTMRTKKKMGAIAAAFAMLFAPAHAQQNQPADPSQPASGQRATGVIEGKVLNSATQRYLERATVTIKETGARVTTDRDGSFRLSGVPAGNYTLVAGYTDLDDTTQAVVVRAGETVNIEVAMISETYVLEGFVVEAEREGNAFMINQQRRADSFRAVASADTFGDNSNTNPGELMRYMSGVQMQYSELEPNAVRMRGMDPSLSLVTMDGGQIASANSSGTSRTIEIDQLSTGAIDSVEVYKTLIPSMPANAIAGAVNFNTKSAFDQKGRKASVTGGFNANSKELSLSKTPAGGHGDVPYRKIMPIGSITYIESFLNNRFGIVFNANHNQYWAPGNSATHSIAFQNQPAFPTPYTQDNVRRRDQLGLAPNQQEVRRDTIGLNFDFKFNDNLMAYLKTDFTDYLLTNRGHSFNLRAGSATTVNPAAATTEYTTTNGTASQGASVFNKITRTWQFRPGLKFKSGDWKIDLATSFSRSMNHYVNPTTFRAINISMSGLNYTMVTLPNTVIPASIVRNSGPDFYDLNNYSPSNNFVQSQYRKTMDTVYGGSLDVQRNFATRFPFYLKTGISHQSQTRNQNNWTDSWNWAGPANFMGNFAEPAPLLDVNWAGYAPVYISSEKVYGYYKAHPEHFTPNASNATNPITGKRDITETINSAYLMGKVQLNDLEVITGVRVEHTKDTGIGPVTRGSVIRATSTKEDKQRPFKYLVTKYSIMPNLQSRAAYTEGIGRPDFTNIVPGGTVNDTTKVLSINNTNLKPQRSKNYDLSLEYYAKGTTFVSVGWFRRDVRDYISSANSTLPVTQDILDEWPGIDSSYTIQTRTNVGKTRFEGVEIDTRLQFSTLSFMPKVLQGFEVFANYTYTYKSTGDFGIQNMPKVKQLAQATPRMFNGGVAYRYRDFYIQAAVNYQSDQLASNTGSDGQSGQTYDAWTVWNLDASYKLTKRIQIKLSAKNIAENLKTRTTLGYVVRHQNDVGIPFVVSTKIDL